MWQEECEVPIIAGAASILILIKQVLQGFTTMFPMEGVAASYEGRYSLRTVCRTIPIFIFGMVPILIVVYLAQPRWGLGPALALTWVAFGAALGMLLPGLRAPRDMHSSQGDRT